MASRYIALIPAFEPGRNMLGVIADLGKTGMDVVLVDDGSGIEYADLFEQAAERLPGKTGKGVTLLIHDKNKGKGAALKTGLDFIGNFMVMKGEEKETVIVTVDADGQHLAKDAARAACAAAKKPGALILGSRALGRLDTGLRKAGEEADKEAVETTTASSDRSRNTLSPAVDEKTTDIYPGSRFGNTASATDEKATDIPLRSRFGNAVTRKVFALASGVKVYDTQTGLRAFTADLIPDLLKVKGDRYEYEINMLLEAAGAGIPIEEIRIETVYLNGNEASHFNTIKDSYRIYKEIGAYMTRGSKLFQEAKFSASSFVSFLIDYAVYALLLLIGPGLVFANIGARLVSSMVNFTINRKLVFRSDKSILRSMVQYFALAAFILAGNTFVLSTLVGTLGIGSMAAKVFTEILFFMLSWTVQKYAVFYSRADGDRTEAKARGEGVPDRFLVQYTAVKPGKLRDVHRSRSRA